LTQKPTVIQKYNEQINNKIQTQFDIVTNFFSFSSNHFLNLSLRCSILSSSSSSFVFGTNDSQQYLQVLELFQILAEQLGQVFILINMISIKLYKTIQMQNLKSRKQNKKRYDISRTFFC
jgi:hypothetical protein